MVIGQYEKINSVGLKKKLVGTLPTSRVLVGTYTPVYSHLLKVIKVIKKVIILYSVDSGRGSESWVVKKMGGESRAGVKKKKGGDRTVLVLVRKD